MPTNTRLVGIINVTPDSFSDGGNYFDSGEALAKIRRLIDDGAHVIDIGAESTRPGAELISHEEELNRLAIILERLDEFNIPISIDTRHPQTASLAIKHGVKWINDVSGFSSPEMIAAVRDSDCKLVVMHSLSVPPDKNITLPESADVIKELCAFAHTRMGYMEKHGIDRGRIIFDPGIGFGKTAEQSWEIIKRISELKAIKAPILVGHSRKSFLSSASGLTNEERDQATLAVSRELTQNGVDFLRVHNIKAHILMLNVLKRSA